MVKIKTIDKYSIDNSSEFELTEEGYLVLEDVKIARSGIQEYMGYQLGLEGDMEYKIVNVLRPPSEVFSKDSMKTFENKPATNTHPWDMLHSANVKEFSVGYSGSRVYEKDGHLTADRLVITDAETINEVRVGNLREISNGYYADYEEEEGVFDGIKYSFIQRNIKGNHIALVRNGRCGGSCSVGDEDNNNQGEKPMIEINVGGVPVKVADESAKAVIEKHIEDVKTKATADATKATTDSNETKITELNKAHDEAIAAKDSEIAELKKNQLTVETLDAAIKSRMATIEKAKNFLPEDFVFDGKDCDCIKKEAIKASDESVNLDDKSDDYIQARWDALKSTKDSVTDTTFSGTATGDGGPVKTRDSVREKYLNKFNKTEA